MVRLHTLPQSNGRILTAWQATAVFTCKKNRGIAAVSKCGFKSYQRTLMIESIMVFWVCRAWQFA